MIGNLEMDRYRILGAAKKTASMIGKAVLAVVEIGFTIWVSELNAKQKAKEDAQAAKRREEEEKPPIIAEFRGNVRRLGIFGQRDKLKADRSKGA
jgi:hypothetical protein